MYRFRMYLTLITVVIGLLLTVGLSTNAQETQEEGERLQILASYSILADVIRNVAGTAADVTSLVPLGADPHSYVPTPRELTTLADADVVFVNGVGFEEGLMEILENADTDINMIVTSYCIEIIPIGFDAHNHGDEEHDHEDEEHDHEDEEHADEEHDEDHEHEDEEHADGEHDHEDESTATAMLAGMNIADLCSNHYAEMDAIHEAGHDHEGEEHADEEHADEEHADEEHEHDEEHDHGHAEVETLGPLYTIDCGDGHAHEGEEHTDDEDEHDEGDEHEGHNHEEGACDGHVWMNPHNAMYWAMLARDVLSDIDPANADLYAANAETYVLSLDALAHEFVGESLETIPEENRVFVTNHEFLGYLAAWQGFEVAGVVIPGGATGAEANAGAIAELIEVVNDEGVPAIFGETTISSDIAERIAEETGAAFYSLLSGTLTDADGVAPTYIDYVRYNITVIVEALGGEVIE